MSSTLGGLVSLLGLAAGLAGDSEPVHVAGGAEVPACGWPTVVRMSSNCSGTLIHPQVVVYAGHCGTAQPEVIVGEVQAEGTPYATDGCWENPAWNGSPGGSDFAVCRLAQPVADVAIVPVLMGCELQLLQPGVDVTSVGFGNAPDGPNGVKRAVSFPIVGVDVAMNTVAAGGDAGTLCAGDSGGGTFVQGIDGSWRLFGVNSAVAGMPCVSGPAVLAVVADVLPWIEEQTGLDVTPCYAADGTWDPDERCTAVPLDPGAGGGAWPMCDAGPLSEPLSTCGVPVTGQDLVPPTVSISEPADGQVIPLRGDTVAVPIALVVDDGDGFGVAETRVRIDGQAVDGTGDDWVPFEVPDLTFPAGTYTLEAVALDWAGNEAVSAAVVIVVGDPPASDESDGGVDETGSESTTTGGDIPDDDLPAGTTSEDAIGDATDGATGGAADAESEATGCRVGAPRRGDLWAGAFALFAFLRRRSASPPR